MTPNAINDSLNRLISHIWENDPASKFIDGEPPFRSELFNAEQMEQHGKKLAGLHILGPKVSPDHQLLSRLNQNEVILIEVHDLIMEAVNANRQITPAGEWLLDNFYLIEEHIRTGKRHFPKNYSEELPRLLNGSPSGLPRVYDIAKEIISHGDGTIDPESLTRFVNSYQTVTTLKIGELWAIPIMLRFALIENLRRVASRVAHGQIDRNLADSWVDRMTDIIEKDPKSIILVIADMARSNPPMTAAFVSEFARRLQGQSTALTFPLTWLEQRLSESNESVVQLIQLGNQQLASDQVSISNSIASLRFLAGINWPDFVENLSVVDKILQNDPIEAYSKMDFATRDQYRHVIEKIAKSSPLAETEVASKAIEMAQQVMLQKGTQDRAAHVGYYLIDKGLRQLELNSKTSFTFPQKLKRLSLRLPLLSYLGSIFVIISILTWGFLEMAYSGGIEGWLLWMIGAVLALSTSCLAVTMVNWLVTFLSDPKPLPRMDFTKRVPSTSQSLVVIPTMIANVHNIETLVEDMEVRFLANRDENIYFGLLTDFLDANAETLPEDEPLITYLSEKVKILNEKYKKPQGNIFFLFHRARVWNPNERVWMGYERKRGKLSDLNALLRGNSRDKFSVIIGSTNLLQNVKYVITLDTDTELPRDSARQFIGTMSHPLNSPHFDTKKQIVTEGYTILQPRVAVSLVGTNRSRYARLFGHEPGIDPYTRASSDVYQDLFSEGSFIGKGIYDVDSFEQTISNRFPENRILSHDLLEGCYVRAGLISDVLLFEDYPTTYYADVKRRHRWIRGDWQLLPWLLPFVPVFKGPSQRNPLSALSRWKLFDNLRRSLVPFGLTALLLIGWTLPSPWFWTLVVIGIIFIPSLVISTIDLFDKPEEVLFRQHLIQSREGALRHLTQAAFMLMNLPYEAFYSLDAILRTCWRLIVSKKRLLEWNPSGNTNQLTFSKIISFFQFMWIAPLISTISIVGLAALLPISFVVAWPFLVLWFVSPAIVWSLSRPITPHLAKFTSAQNRFLFNVSRKTWFFFEKFVTERDNWLPPDNFQEHPNPVIAHRTSPTNVGLSLLANLTAYDFGYIHAGELLVRTSNTFNTLKMMEKYRGHFYNWYDTESLKPLQPLYISSVDSGNLAGHLLTLKPGLLSMPDQKILGNRLLEGINDTLMIIVQLSGKRVPESISNFLKIMETYLGSPPNTVTGVWQCLNKLKESSEIIVKSFKDKYDSLVAEWANTLMLQCQHSLDELMYLAPWANLPSMTKVMRDDLNIEEMPTLRQLAKLSKRLSIHTNSLFLATENTVTDDFSDFLRLVKVASDRANERINLIKNLANQANEFSRMKFDFLYDASRHLLSIGYNVDDRRRDSSFYDLLASEARLSTFIAIAQGQIPQESWFALGRLLTITSGEPTLLSWSGSMFEYLMPLIVMPTYENSLLHQTCNGAVIRQIEYGKQRGVPWGISESGYNNFDIHLNYQYRAFGVPGLGLKRGLSEDLVISPYATMLALIVKPEEACDNLEYLEKEGFMGKYGFYEAIDYTQSRLPRGQSNVIVKSYMSHHVGMSFLSLSYALLDRPMQKRFEANPLLQATILLLQERIPRATAFQSHSTSATMFTRTNIETQEMPLRIFNTPNTPFPEVHLLSNGRYQTMISNAGGGYSHWKDIAVTRWREDSTCDNWGTFCYIRDADSGYFWSTAYQPTLKSPDKYEAIFSEGRAEFRRRDKEIDTHTEIVVSPEDDIELRRVHLTNRTRNRRIIDITSYAEVVLMASAAEASHPAFNNLFIQTEIVPHRQALLCTRRPRAIDDNSPWMFHLMAVHGAEIKNITYETDRLKFIGRGNTVVNPKAMTGSGALSNSQGSVLDPIASIQYQIVLEPEGSVTIDIVTGVAEAREDALVLIEKYQDQQLANRVFELAWTHSQVVLQQINAIESDAQLYGRIASSIIYTNSSLRSSPSIITKNRRGQSGLWGYSISGDLPIVLVQIEDANNINLVRELIQAHAYWRVKGLIVDLVIWNENHAGYRQALQDQIMDLITAGMEANIVGKRGGIFLRSGDQLSAEDRILFQTIAKVVISDKRGSLAEQVNRRIFTEPSVPLFRPSRPYRADTFSEAGNQTRDLLFFNGTGGFTRDGQEYIITTDVSHVTPLPWSNVIANNDFGTVISENGQAYTWSENAHEFRITPWDNDSVCDTGGEAIYIRDEETGHFWTATPIIKTELGHYITRHGFGYSVFEHTENGIATELRVYVSIDSPVKFSSLKIKNLSGKPRKLSVTGYVEWVLGDQRQKTAMHVVTESEINNTTIFARNSYNPEFSERVAFFQTNEVSDYYFTCDRTEFLGRNGTLTNPSAMGNSRLSGKRGGAIDPCAAIQVPFELADRQEREIIFMLGSAKNTVEANRLANRFRGSSAALHELEKVWDYWKQTLGTIHIETPDIPLNILTNGWLLYQTLACRIWARSGYYQSGGAFGFRDQLQDSMALVHSKPQIFRDQIILHASRQFIEGDVQHWWHPPFGRGVRTRCSDDYLWLPLATCRYVLSTGDTGILDESIYFLEGRPVNPEEDSYYDLPNQSKKPGTLFQHCVRAILHGLRYGDHGLPLIGTCDWNDGMNKVGDLGKGESVWLAFFLYEVLTQFNKLATIYGDLLFAERCLKEAEVLRGNIEQNGWDGEWYLRAYFDDGSPLGSSKNEECKIDSIAQSWSVLSKAGDYTRSRTAMESVNKRLVRREKSLVQLLDPPFDKSNQNPGYIKGYVPGVRENGGQYTHASIWAAMAFAKLKDAKNAWEITSMINPINLTKSSDDINKYKVEPYVLAADVYAMEPHVGRGGWTWYTGSAGWMYRLITESLLGLRLEAEYLYIDPCLPDDWTSFKLNYRFHQTVYKITMVKKTGNQGIVIDGVYSQNMVIHLLNDQREHLVEVSL